MTRNKLAIIGGSGLYDVEEFTERELINLNTPWGKPSDQILKTIYKKKEVYFLPRHGRGHFISPSNINFRANIDALKQLGVTDIVSVSAVGSLKEELPPDFQTAEFLEKHGFVDRVIHRKDLKKEISTILTILLKKESEVNSEISNETSDNTESLTKAAS